MTLPRADIGEGLVNQLISFEDLLRSLSPAELDSSSRCVGWTCGDVARHVVGQMADVMAGRLEGLGSPEVTAREVSERSGRNATELADECAEVAKGSTATTSAARSIAPPTPAPGCAPRCPTSDSSCPSEVGRATSRQSTIRQRWVSSSPQPAAPTRCRWEPTPRSTSTPSFDLHRSRTIDVKCTRSLRR